VSIALDRSRAWHRGARGLGAACAATLGVVLTYRFGIPVEHVEVLAICMLVSLVAAGEFRARGLLALLADWLPIAAVLIAFDYLHGAAAQTGIGPDFVTPARWDHWLTGTIPTVDLQNWMYGRGYFRWWNVPVTLVYLSYFVVPYAILVTLWIRNRPAFRGFRLAYVVTTVLSLTVFLLRPTAPPWASSEHGVIGLVSRTAALGLRQLHLHAANALVSWGMAAFNPYSAFPSLHAAVSALPVLWWGVRTSWPRRLLLVAYPLAMGFVLVATGEHWVTDVVAGWVCAGAGVLVARRIAGGRRPLRRFGV
jgi:uncharacterized membrane protein YczE